jgi:hypothetical protein
MDGLTNLRPLIFHNSAALADLSTRLANLEVERKQLRSMFETMQTELSIHNSRLWKWKVSRYYRHV